MSTKVVDIVQVGDFKKTFGFLNAIRQFRLESILDKYGQRGVSELSAATPMRTGKTAASWRYEIDVNDYSVVLSFHNDSMGSDGKTPIVFLIHYGHGTKNGGYVPPNNFMGDILTRLYDDMAKEVWEVLRSL